MQIILAGLRRMFIGALIFWGVYLLWYAVRRHHYSGLDVLILTALTPFISISALLFMVRKSLYVREDPRKESLLWLLGIWFFGPFFISLSATLTGGGMATWEGFLFMLVGTVFFPIFDFLMGTYSGMLGALFFVTLLLPLVGLMPAQKQESKRLPLS